MSAVSLGIVIPTRNRAQLAINACQSLLAQPGCDFRVFVSDNSTQPEELARLSSYCAGAGTSRLTYLKPPQPLPMATHWDWALRTAMAGIDATHFNIHYDRRITKPGHLALVCEVMSEFPDDVVTWTLDVIADEPGVSVVGQIPWDGNVYAGTDRPRCRDDRKRADCGNGSGVSDPLELRGAPAGAVQHRPALWQHL